MMIYKAIKGTRDLLPEDIYKRRHIEKVAIGLFENWGYLPISTPVFEQTELFVRGIGEDSEIVQKEMYTFKDRKGRSLTLRPEGTAPIVRAYIENNLYSFRNPTKLYYFLPMYRYERPQKGRMREFFQIGVELIGAQEPDSDAEVIALLVSYLDALGVKDFENRINSIGCRKCRRGYNNLLKTYLSDRRDSLCGDCKERINRNPMRVFDCKNLQCSRSLEGAPRITDYICENCLLHFEGVKRTLDFLGIPYVLDKKLVRGFDYYEKTTFEVISPLLGAQDAIGGGGRYDPLVGDCGGMDTPGLGFAIGVERLLLQMREEKVKLPGVPNIEAYVCFIGDELKTEALKLLFDLRRANISADMDFIHRSLKTQLKNANKLNAKVAIIVGPEEQSRNSAKIRDMKTGEEREVEKEELISFILRIAGGKK